jgi:hypothetical protein
MLSKVPIFFIHRLGSSTMNFVHIVYIITILQEPSSLLIAFRQNGEDKSVGKSCHLVKHFRCE